LSRSLFSASVAGLALVAVAAAAVPAQAARLRTSDPAADVWQRGDDGVWSEAGSVTNVDVLGSAVRHTSTFVHGSARYATLERGEDRFVLPVRLRTSAGVSYEVRIVATEERNGGTLTLIRGTADGPVRVPCRGTDHLIDYDEEITAFSVPRRCLGNPTWVRYGGVARLVTADGTVYTDALLSGDPVNDLWSPRIKRG
jgi:hypothetical protein